MVVDVSDLHLGPTEKWGVYFYFEVAKSVYEEDGLHPIEESRRTCRCVIYDILPDGDKTLLGEGTAFCHPNDQFRRVVGRSIAFDKAFKKMKMFSDLPYSYVNEIRRIIKKRVFQ